MRQEVQEITQSITGYLRDKYNLQVDKLGNLFQNHQVFTSMKALR